MGRVYRAFDPLARRRVAIKTPKTEYAQGAEAEEYVARFRREAQSAAALSHPHIVTVFDVGENYFVMELLEGVTLQTVLSERGKLELPEALRVLEPIAGAVDLAHGKGIIHRDIKPANVFLLADGRVKIMDFGVAHLVSTSITAAGQFLGSPAYMAPEQITGGQASARTDLFSLSVVAYQMLTGHKPFEGENVSEVVYRVAHTDPAPPSAWTPDLPPAHDDVFRRALAKDPATRFASATAFVAALDRRRGSPSAPSAVDIETQDLKAGPERRRASDALAPVRRRWFSGRAALLAAMVVVPGALGWAAMREGGLFVARPSAASVAIMTDPPNALARVDGLRVGRTPVTHGNLSPGPHTVQVMLDGFAPAELNLQLQGEALPVPLRFVLQPTGAVLELRSEPAAAAVRLDGKPAGLTPIEELPTVPGKHEVQIEHAGFRPWIQTVEVSAGDRIPLTARLERSTRTAAASAHLTQMGWVRAGDRAVLGPDVTPPEKISGEPAPYPSSAKWLKLEGTVAVELTVAETGEPVDVRVVRSGGALLDAAMVSTVKTWRYTPALKNGVKVRVRIQAQQKFPYKK